MNATKTIGIVSATVLLASILIQVQSAAAVGFLGYGGVSRLQAHVYLTTSDGKAKDVKVSVSYKGIEKDKKVTVRSSGQTEVEFVFPPIEMGWFDTVEACAENTRTDEINCKTVLYYFNRNQPQNIYLDVFNTRS
jgi:hypothetical protein